MGDAAGIGPEICLRALAAPEVRGACVPLLFGDLALLRRVAAECGLPGPERSISLSEWEQGATPDEPGVLDVPGLDAAAVTPGQLSAACGRTAYRYIEEAIRAAQAGRVRAVVTAPINKEALSLAGIRDPGHTEIFTRLTSATRTCMMQTSEELTVSFVTTHVAYAEAPRHLSVARIMDVIELTAAALRRIRGRAPRLLVCGLNPHAGEHGLFGAEEKELIAPAVEKARHRGVDVDGPVPPDTAFIPERRRGYDAIVCMYHDQGHIPFKMLAFDTGVNVTLGLPIVRTSVDHGTAFDIAWKGVARESSLLHAIRMALRLGAGGGGDA